MRNNFSSTGNGDHGNMSSWKPLSYAPEKPLLQIITYLHICCLLCRRMSHEQLHLLVFVRIFHHNTRHILVTHVFIYTVNRYPCQLSHTINSGLYIYIYIYLLAISWEHTRNSLLIDMYIYVPFWRMIKSVLPRWVPIMLMTHGYAGEIYHSSSAARLHLPMAPFHK